MKKVLVVMMAFVMGMAVTSCKQGPKAEGETAGQEEVTKQTPADPIEALTAVVEKAKAEGANWTVDQWKDAMKEAMVAIAPIMKEMAELTGSVQGKEGEEPDAAKIAEVAGKLEEFSKKYEPMEPLMSQLDSIAKASENGKTVLDDKEFEKQLKQELGLPEDF